jgi:hypothetical protein
MVFPAASVSEIIHKASGMRGTIPRLSTVVARRVYMGGRTELTSGTPLGPASPRSRVVEALQRRGAGVHDVSARADIGSGAVATITTTTTASFIRDGHCSGLPRLRLRLVCSVRGKVAESDVGRQIG